MRRTCRAHRALTIGLRSLMLACAATVTEPAVGASEPAASASDGIYVPAATTQTEADEYTRYELLDPASARFRIIYEVTATTTGAQVFYNPIRKGSVASDESVIDAASGKPLQFDVVSGAEAKRDPLMPDADVATSYIRVRLARPVPEHGQARVVIRKTYTDRKSYYPEGQALVFDRPLGVPRNTIVLPAGYSLASLSVPSQILTEPDGRIAVSFLHAGAGEAPLKLRALANAQSGAAALPHPASERRSWESPYTGPTESERLTQRAHEGRDIVYFLQPPQTHAFMLYHDYTESRPGVSGYANVVRSGSTASQPSAVDLDTGSDLAVRAMRGAQLAASGINVGEAVEPSAHVVVIAFAPITPGHSRRLRITETYTAPVSYGLDGDELVFDRSLGRPRNAIVLPKGWYCTFSAEPATLSTLPDGRVRLDYWNDRPEGLDVLLKARRTRR